MQQQQESQTSQATNLLQQLDVLLVDPANLLKARALASLLQEQYSSIFSNEERETFKTHLKTLQKQEAEQKHQRDLAVQVEQLKQQLADSQQKCTEAEQRYQGVIREKETLQSSTLALKQTREEIDRLKKLAATVAALIYVKRKELLLSEERITFYCNEYIKFSNKGANPGYPASVRNVILRRFQDCFEAYEKLIDRDDI